ncbi:aminotransferase class I/II-fold pyridoxal phosphate-dependent enzyme [Cellulomonas dongxiuzhuiae]|uniref:Aminotransferase class I/II-fold pyridoxal phosphate-dependent enzyme n=1 Tax=Cellulomonas dongxiuzhuiae TaxID=2819979 RepID=A0ABX8GNS4_9CELL|nr:aminotransferase class I/II-fold pyridoxal phosphate-dependent enzyme [Cellulomonas dongxiuzhuiae]MBO3087608.1 aminotransferase class I/II-fold pyridoxal phosphate-dependent enzyme [Cellulomonas dongxiuzhuiae]MBO3096033.1 aminotransferase class I/II-fold pyridoxal phosphate-dependent enzyme [Cellulomonas dongxiuzhuiae]QWC17311.1 aminotransferase class I/II-fold pyridoxal phosphate-dependent enzyme [Cellulomonas dongxiuzhuiae]
MSPQELAELVVDRSPRGIAATIARLVHTGDLLPGDRLPTVRQLAVALGVSPATVGSAWQTLAAAGLVISRGRAGTSVLPGPAARLPPRYRDLADVPAARLDLAAGTPDPELLPDLSPALTRLATRGLGAHATGYLDDPVVPGLERLLRSSWPFVPQRLTVVDGAVDALSRVLEQVVGFGGRVAVEDPGFPPVLDLLDHLGLERVPVTLDASGPRPDALAEAVRSGVRVVVLQPRAQNPTGISITPTRARELAAVLRPAAGELWVLEDDHSGEVASSRDVSLGTLLADRVVHVRSYSKSHGPDLRIAAVGGPAVVLDGLVARRMLGPGWTSRLLQHVLVDLLTDAQAVEAVAHARRIYHGRRRTLSAALARHGVQVPPGDGINMWVPVADERAALVRLEAAGVRVARGRPFFSDPARAHGFVRVTVGVLRPDDVETVAAALAAAAAP